MIRVLVADDHPIVRGGIVGLLASADDIEVVGEAVDGPTAVSEALRLEPDIVLMDLRMPGFDGDEATARILAERPGIRVVVLTTYESDASILTAIEAGASGYLLKAAPQEEILEGVRSVARGEVALAPGIAALLVKRVATPSDHAQPSRNRGARARRAGQQQPGDRGAPAPERGHGEDAPAARVREARRAGSHASGDEGDGVGGVVRGVARSC